MSRISWPNGKKFAFTIIDDTDHATVENIGSIYSLLEKNGIKSTKTVWVYPPRDKFTGETAQDEHYLNFLLDLEKKGFEIQMHNVGSGSFSREEIIKGLEEFKDKFGRYPKMHINHSKNPDNLYWGYKRHGFFLRTVIKLFKGKTRRFYGEEEGSEHYWADHAHKRIKFIRNRVFNGINTLKYDPKMPFKEKRKKYANYWFSSSDGHTIAEFNELTSKDNIDRLSREGGLCIVYTHFACGFLNDNGELNEQFKKNIEYIGTQDGWFAPATEILEFLASNKKEKYANPLYINWLDLKWLIDRVKKRIKFGH